MGEARGSQIHQPVAGFVQTDCRKYQPNIVIFIWSCVRLVLHSYIEASIALVVSGECVAKRQPK